MTIPGNDCPEPGLVAVKVRRGAGRKSPLLLVVTEDTWRRMNGPVATS